MSIIKADVCEIEIQEQTMKDAGCKYMVIVKSGDVQSGSIDLAKIILTDQKPIIKNTIDDGNTVNVKDN
tara:strand:- start:2968 stop:3174 length:207 start_codon:yes stop_codon:yes gene_type:complete